MSSRDIVLRPYQEQIIKSVNKSAERGIKRQMLVAFMGLGKTLTTTHIIDQKVNQTDRALILVDQKDLIPQWKDSLLKTNPNLQIGIEQADNRAKKTDKVVIATVQTLGREGVKRIKRFDPDHFRYCFVDECDRSIAETWFRVLEYFGFGKDNFNPDNLLLGMTGTPYRSDGQSLGLLYDDIVENFGVRYALKEGWLNDFILKEVSTNTDLTQTTTQEEVDEAVNNDERNRQVLKAYKELNDKDKTLVYCASVDHAYRLCDMFNENDIPSGIIEANTKTEEREELFEGYRKGEIRVLFNYGTLARGIDLPETSMLMLLRPVQSKSLLLQIMGRGLRPSSTAFVDAFDSAEKRKQAIEHSAKPHCKIIDFYDKVANQNFTHVPSLFGLNNELKTNEPKKFYKEVVEPIEDKAKEHGFDKTKVTNLDDIDLIVKNRKVDIASLKTDPKIEQFTSRKWISVGENSYEIIYGDENKVLMIEPDQSKDQLLDKKEWNLLEYDTKDETTKKLQTFNSLSGAFKVGDEYADQSGWNSTFKKKAEWMSNPPSEKQIELLKKLYTYKTGYSEIRTLNERYSNGARKVLFKKTGDILDRGSASTLIENKFSS